MKTVTCCVCSVQFGLDDVQYNQRHKDGEIFYCPNGHALVFTENKIAGLKAQIEKLEGTIAQLQETVEFWETQYYPESSGAIRRLTADRTLARRRAAGYKGKWMQVKAERDRIASAWMLVKAQRDRLADAMPSVPHPGGVLVEVVAHYEDGSTQTIAGEIVMNAIGV